MPDHRTRANEIIDELNALAKRHRKTTDIDINHGDAARWRALMIEYWNLPALPWQLERDDTSKTERFRPRGTAAERIANRLLHGTSV